LAVVVAGKGVRHRMRAGSLPLRCLVDRQGRRCDGGLLGRRRLNIVISKLPGRRWGPYMLDELGIDQLAKVWRGSNRQCLPYLDRVPRSLNTWGVTAIELPSLHTARSLGPGPGAIPWRCVITAIPDETRLFPHHELRFSAAASLVLHRRNSTDPPQLTHVPEKSIKRGGLLDLFQPQPSASNS